MGKNDEPKGKRRRQARPYTFTPAMETMRQDMSQVKKLDEVLDDEFTYRVQPKDAWVTKEALDLIDRSNLTMSLKDWAKVQELVEQGLKLGYARGKTPGL